MTVRNAWCNDEDKIVLLIHR